MVRLSDQQAAKTDGAGSLPAKDDAYTYKVATEEWEFEQIGRLNYETFVEEIPQHPEGEERILVDRFHNENTYFVCLKGGQLVGMVAVRDKRPFSLDQKLGDLDAYLPDSTSICEVRLLSIARGLRRRRIILGLLTMVADHWILRGHDLAIISANLEQDKLYRGIGFVPFGPPVGTQDAMYQPMYKRLANVGEEFDGRLRRELLTPDDRAPVNLLPGPVGVRPEVREAFARDPVSHRSAAFVEDFGRVKRMLCELVGARHAEILLGSGTLANDVIAGQLSLGSARGLVLVNGEFGERLKDHASRMRLSFDVLSVGWGDVFDRAVIERALDRGPEVDWLWAVHCETSTGVLNDLATLKEVCAERGIRLCVDCISSIGTVPVDLDSVHLASGVSGKGLGALPGLSMVFYNHDVEPAPEALPRYLDLGLHAAKNGVPFTTSSNLVYALEAALRRFRSPDALSEVAGVSRWLRRGLRELGFHIVAPDAHTSPAVTTIALPPSVSSGEVGRELEESGYLLSCHSDYLLERNWIQVCLMGEYSRPAVERLLKTLNRYSPA